MQTNKHHKWATERNHSNNGIQQNKKQSLPSFYFPKPSYYRKQGSSDFPPDDTFFVVLEPVTAPELKHKFRHKKRLFEITSLYLLFYLLY